MYLEEYLEFLNRYVGDGKVFKLSLPLEVERGPRSECQCEIIWVTLSFRAGRFCLWGVKIFQSCFT